MRKIEVKIRYAIWAFKRSFKPCALYYARFEGVLWSLRNDIYDEKVWTLIRLRRLGADKTKTCVNVSQFKVVIPSIDAYFIRFSELYDFQKKNWFMQDSRKRFGRRISYLSSDNIQFG